MRYADIELEPGITVMAMGRERKWISPKHGRGYYSRTEREMGKHTRIYIWAENETLMENLICRTSRPIAIYRKLLVDRVLPKLGMSEATISWNQHAGCGSCPCSPGFVVKGNYGIEGPVGKGSWETIDLSVTVDHALLGLPVAIGDPDVWENRRVTFTKILAPS